MKFENEAKFDQIFQKWQSLHDQKNLFSQSLTKNLHQTSDILTKLTRSYTELQNFQITKNKMISVPK